MRACSTRLGSTSGSTRRSAAALVGAPRARARPRTSAVLKLDLGVSGLGNALLDLDAAEA